MSDPRIYHWRALDTGGFPARIPVEVGVKWRLETNASVWVIRPGGYVRLPRNGGHRSGPDAIDSVSFVDGALIPHREAWLINDNGFGWVLQIVPSHRPEGSYGIHSGRVLTASVPPPTDQLNSP